MNKLILIACITSLFFIKSFAQVNVQTGSAVFNLPMFNWQDDKSHLHFSMNLSYNSGNGLKVNNIASTIGQGWNLNAGGVIARIQNGEPDDQYPYHNPSDLTEKIDDATKYPAGYLYNPDDVSTKGCPQNLARYPIFKDKNHIYKQHNVVAVDRELDYFTFTFNGKNGLFVLNKNDNTGFLLGDSKVKIWYTLSPTDLVHTGDNKKIRTRISTFYIQDEDGLIYRFGTYEIPALPVYGFTKVLRTAYCDVNGIQSLTQPSFKGGQVYYEGLFDDPQIVNPYVIDCWFLTEIDDPFSINDRKIQFTYTIKTVTDPPDFTISYNKDEDYSIISRKATQSEVPELTGIGLPDNQYLINVNYGAPRLDLKPTSNTEQVMSSIDVQYKIDIGSYRYLSRYELKTGYFILNRYGTPNSDFEKNAARLCLLSVKKYGPDLKADENPYLFDYNLGSNSTDDFVPPYSFALKDIWGYYNGTNSKDYNGNDITTKPVSQLTIFDITNSDCRGLCFMKSGVTGVVLNAKNGYSKNGLLRQVIYPTGGAISYDYVQNTGTFTDGSTTTYMGGVHVSKTSVTDGGYSNGCSNPITTSYNYVLTDGTSSLWGAEKPVNVSPVSTNAYSTSGHRYTWGWHNFPVGSCSYKYQYPGIIYQEENTSLKWTQVALMVISDVLDVVSALTEIKEIVTVCTGGSPLSLVLDVIFGLVDLWISCHSNINKTFTSTVYYNTDLNSSNPLPTQFKRVEVVPNTGDIGKTIETFTSSDDYPLWFSANPYFLMQQRYGQWEYGMPKLVTTFDKDGNKVKETEYAYSNTYLKHEFACNSQSKSFNQSIINAQPLCTILASCNCQVLVNRSQPSDAWADVSNISYGTTPDIGVHVYYYYSGRLNLTDVYERTFKPNSTQYLQTSTHYDYDDNLDPYSSLALNISKITTTQSNGDTTYKYLKYSGDFPQGVLANLDAANNVSVPVETVNSVKRFNTSAEQFLNDKVTEFTTAATGDIVPSRTLEQRFSAPQSSLTWYSGPGGTTNPSYKQTQTFTYDANGNLTGLSDEGNHTVTSIYDYADKYVVASVINADPVLDKPAYTSFETSSLGGWTLTGTPTYSSSAITGVRALNLSSGISLKVSNLNTARAYKLSFWASNSGVIVSAGATLNNNSFTANGFTYYEYDIAKGTATVTVSGTSTIDELRLYPLMARMTTTTYDPLLGKTSECDENNRITYYEYDELGRPRFIKDEKKNILKMYEYNTVSNNRSGCPQTYSNHLLTETFIKSNCGAGYQGNSVAYSVPAGKYSSNISQSEADQLAQNELDKLGQSNADNTAGACSLIYYNAGKTVTFYTQGCDVTQYGKTVPYTVPAHKYSSIISQAVVDQMEQDEIDANGQANANNPPNAGCITTNDPFYEADDPASTRCQVDANGSHTGHLEVFMTDINPNSSTYGSTAWKDIGADETCTPDNGSFPCLNGTAEQTGRGVKVYSPGTVVHITVTLNSSDPAASLTGSISGTGGGGITLSGAGNSYQYFTVTVPSEGYISWSLDLKGTVGATYVCSNISFQ